MANPSPNFRRIIQSAANKELILPVIQSAIATYNFAEFDIHVEPPKERKPDGWFHPSEHPGWTELQLVHLMNNWQNMPPKPIDPTGVLSITLGLFWHKFFEFTLMESGILQAAEWPVEDLEVKSRGHLDGLLEDEGFELKTMNSFSINKIPNGSPDDPAVIQWLIESQPKYAMQAREYNRIANLKGQRFIFMNPSLPFNMREIFLPYDERAAMEVRDKYARVRQHVADQTKPDRYCCAPGSDESKICPVRTFCPIALS